MNNKSALTIILLLASFLAVSAENVDSILRVLDNTIDRRDYYYMIRETRIDSLKQILNIPSLPVESKRDVVTKIFDEYSKYQGDSAKHYATMLNEMPSMTPDDRVRANIAMIFVYTSGGLFNQAITTIEDTDLSGVSDDVKGDYYFLLVRSYSDFSNYVGPDFDDEYARLSRSYADSVIQYKAPDSYEAHYAHVFKTSQTMSQTEKIEEFTQLLNRQDLSLSEKAMISSMLADLYRDKPDRKAMIFYKALSANMDIIAAKHETTASRDLALYLYEDGDVERASHLINLAYDDAKFFNGRHRLAEIANVLPLIEQKRYTTVSSQRNTLVAFVVVFAVMIVALAVAAYYIFKQLKVTHRQRDEIEKQHRQIASAKEAIEKQNQELIATNALIRESNRIKDEYIGFGFSISASYMDKIEKLYQFVENKLINKEYQLLQRSLKRKNLKDEKDAVLQEFDKMFLYLFPSFIEKYQQLFPEDDSHVKVPDNEAMTSEMRIFALIRLGISDSSKIAVLLNYSVNTVNAYKTKAKNRSIVPNEQFESKIMEIKSVSA